MTTSTIPPASVFEHMDPAELLADKNIRPDTLDKEFVASIREHGVLVPIVGVRTSDDRVRVLFGHRRRAAAIEAGLVPVVIVDSANDGEAAEVDRILSQFDENTYRRNLTASEKATVIQGLLDLGQSDAWVKRKMRLGKNDVAAAQTVAGSEAAASASAKLPSLTLEMAAGIAEFDGDKEAVEALTAAAADSPGQFAHQLQRLRDQRDDEAARAALVAKLEKRGIKVAGFPGWSHPKLADLADADGKPLTEKTHRKCPGHAAYMDGRGWASHRYEAVYFCTDPKANGHKRIRGSGPGGMMDQDKDERKKVLAGNKAWRSAEKVRRTWLREFLARPTAPDDALAWMFGELIRGDYTLSRQLEGGWRGAQHLLSFDVDTTYGKTSVAGLIDLFDKAKPGRQQVVALALVLGAYELATDVHTWRRADSLYRTEDSWECRYFAALQFWGYDLSEIEQSVVDGPARARARRDAAIAERARAADDGKPADEGEPGPDDVDPDEPDDNRGTDDEPYDPSEPDDDGDFGEYDSDGIED